MSDLRDRLATALVGRYAIGREIGRGGMAVVYLSRDLRHDRDVALKVLRPELAATLGADRFLQEIHLAAGLAHPHILPLHDSGEADGCLFYVMPYVPGESLRDRLESESQLPLVEALDIAREIADALDYAHRAGVVHRDIKPENILLEAGHAVVGDFGIARAISAAGARVTAAGTTVGTPDYMSPEQAAGVGPLDGRSDIYSLGCVLFEMLAGTPPASMTPPEGPAAGPLRVRDRLAELTALRPTVPPAVAGIVARMLEPNPGDRFATGAEAAEALAAPSGVWTPRSVALRRRRRWGALFVGTAMMVVAALVVLPRLRGAGLDRSLYAVVAFGHDGVAAPQLLNGDQCQSLIYDALGRWQDVSSADLMRVNDARLQRGPIPPTLKGALGIARDVGAGLLIWGHLAQFGDTIVVRGALYDVTRRGVTVREHTVRFGKDLGGAGSKFNELVDSLLVGRVGSRTAAAGATGTHVLAALLAYLEGDAALAVWDVAGARRAFLRAVRLDPEYPQANLSLAEVTAWLADSTALWRPYAIAAATARDLLDARDGALAEALLALADGKFAQACQRYERIIARDSNSFPAWFGLGECHRLDQTVVRDSTSRSGWRFRTSYQTALRAYGEALRVAPSAYFVFRGQAFQHLAALLYSEPSQVRWGYAIERRDTLSFAAFPSFEGDSLAFVPYPRNDVFGGGRPEAHPQSHIAAVERNRRLLREITLRWVRAFPDSTGPYETLGLVLETLGEMGEGGATEQSALLSVRRARSMAGTPQDQLRLAVAETRLVLKSNQFARARALADSILQANTNPDSTEAVQMAGLAALTGRAHLAARLFAAGGRDSAFTGVSGTQVIQPLVLATTGLALWSYAALGSPRDSIIVLAGRVDSLVNVWVAPARRSVQRDALLDRPRMWAFPLLAARPVQPGRPGDGHVQMLYDLEAGDTAAVRERLTRLRKLRVGMRIGDVAIIMTYEEVRVLLAIGDTAAAVLLLDQSIGAPGTLGTDLLDVMPLGASLVRAMILRAELAERAGDHDTARRWATAVVELWGKADNNELQDTVSRMRQLVDRR